MNRLLVALLAAVDALIAAAVGVAAALAPLTVLWVLGFGVAADWGGLWPTAARIWQLGHLVPLSITLPPEFLNAAGIPADGAAFWLSVAPLAFAAFTVVFAARSGMRAARAGEWIIGVATGTLVTAAVAALLWRTSANPIAAVFGWQALLLPTLCFVVPALLGGVVGAWRFGDDGPVDAVRDRIRRRPDFAEVPAAACRGLGIAVAGFIGAGALLMAAATVLRGGEIIALFEAAHTDALGAAMVAIGQLAYLPNLVVFGGAFAAGPGFAIGSGTAVSPAGTTLGVLPGIPVLGIVPEASSPWLLLSVLLIVAAGFVAGAAARGGISPRQDRSAPRLVVLAVIVVGGGAVAALLAAVAAGSLGPGRLSEVGPAPGPVALAVGLELLVGAAIALFGPVRHDEADDADGAEAAAVRAPHPSPLPDETSTDDAATEPFARADLDPLVGPGGAGADRR